MDESQYNEEFDKILAELASEEEASDKFKTAEEIAEAEAKAATAPPEESEESEDDDNVPAPAALSPEDSQAALDAMNRKLEVLGYQFFQQQQQRQQPQPQPQYPAQQNQQPEQPYVVTSDQLAPMQQMLQQMQRAQAQQIFNQEVANYKQAEAALRAKYKDFDSLVPEHERARAFDMLAKSGSFGNNWMQRFENGYKVLAFEGVQKRADELQAKRDSKRAATSKAAAVVPPSGAVFQPPEVKLERSKRGWSDARNATVEALRAL